MKKGLDSYCIYLLHLGEMRNKRQRMKKVKEKLLFEISEVYLLIVTNKQ